MMVDDEARGSAVLLVCTAVIERGEFVGGAREFGLGWREEADYDRWVMAIYRQMATEFPMPERLYQKQMEGAAESEDDDSTVQPSPSLTSSSSFSSLLSLISTPSRAPSLGTAAASSSTGSSTLSLTADERTAWERKLALIQSSASPPAYVLPPSLMLVQKHKRGLFLSSTWKKRYVFLTDDIVGLSEEKRGRATQLLVLSVGRASVKANISATGKKGHLFTVDVDVWMKGSTVTWAKRSVLFAVNSQEEVRVWVDAINALVNKRRRVSMSLPWQTPNSRVHHSSLSMAAMQAQGHQRTPSTWAGTAMVPVNRPLLFTQAASSGTASGSSSPVIGATASSPTLFIPPMMASHSFSTSSSSSSPPSASRKATTNGGPYPVSPAPSPPIPSSMDRRRNSITRLAPPSSVETVEEGREEPASGRSDASRGVKEKPPLTPALSVHIDDGEDHIEGTTLLERKDGSGAGDDDAEEKEEEKENDVDDDADAAVEDGDLPTLVTRFHADVETAFDDASVQLGDDERVQAVLAQLQNAVIKAAKPLDAAVDVLSSEDFVQRTFCTTMPTIDVATLSSSLFPPPISSLATLGDIFEWDYDIFALPASSLLPLVYSLFSHLGFFSHFSVALPVFSRFMSSIQQQYADNPFHSFYHAVDVTQTAFVLLTSFHAQRCLTPLEQFSLLIAALCHDVSHPAMNNSYQVNAQTPLAMIYNDQSVLENHHCAVTFHTLSHHACNVFASLHPADYRHARRCITKGILSTDMAVHFSLVDKLQQHVEAAAKDGRILLMDVVQLSEAQRVHLFCVLLHAGDISNPCKRWPLHERWTRALLEELWAQGRREEKEGLTRSPYTDTEQQGVPIGEMTIEFTRTFVLPLFVLLQRLMPEMAICLTRLDANLRQWELEDEKTAKARAAIPTDKLKQAHGSAKTKDDLPPRAPVYRPGPTSTRNNDQRAASSMRMRRNSAV